MFEARLVQGSLMKKLVDAIKDLVTDANWECSSTGISMQAMDTSHVCLVALNIRADGFEHFRCDRTLNLGVHLANFAKILKCAGNDDVITLKAEDECDMLTLMFESPKQDRVSDFDLKLMNIESEQLHIPDTEYSAVVRLPAAEYARICRDLASIGDTVAVSVTKDGVKFSTSGDVGTANVTCRHNVSTDSAEEQTAIELREPVSLTFALRYLNSFAKATPLSGSVQLRLIKDLPIVVEYQVADIGSVKFYLAPKIEDDEMGDQNALDED